MENNSSGSSPGLESFDIVIIGASGGIGQYLVRSFLPANRIIGTYYKHTPDTLIQGPRYYYANLADAQSVSNFCVAIADGLLRPVIIYTPGISPNRLAHKMSDAEWENVLAVNLTGAMRVTRGLLPKMHALRFGRIIYISSVLSRKATPGTSAYSAAKAGICAFSRVVALENAQKGITANALALGYFSVGIINAVPRKYLDKQVLPNIPVGRLGDPSNIAQAIQFLLGADYITGATIDINGGMLSG